jgi:hypothetical protein
VLLRITEDASSHQGFASAVPKMSVVNLAFGRCATGSAAEKTPQASLIGSVPKILQNASYQGTALAVP